MTVRDLDRGEEGGLGGIEHEVDWEFVLQEDASSLSYFVEFYKA